MNIVEKARVFATAAHSAVNQIRKYTGEPYIVHPTEVSMIVGTVPHTDAMLAAAFLHDVLEDTGVTYGVLADEFGLEIADLVLWLTDVSTKDDGNRATRKALDRQHIAHAPAEAQTIKLADLIANTRSIMAYDVAFAKIYLEEKRLLLEVLWRGDPGLMLLARKQVTV